MDKVYFIDIMFYIVSVIWYFFCFIFGEYFFKEVIVIMKKGEVLVVIGCFCFLNIFGVVILEFVIVVVVWNYIVGSIVIVYSICIKFVMSRE